MKMRVALWMSVLAMLLWFALPSAAAAQALNSVIVVSRGQEISGNVATISQDIRVDGTVAGDVTSWSGNITINGHVAGDVVSYAGHIAMTSSAKIDGHVLALSSLEGQTNAHISGQVIGGSKGSATVASVIDLFTPRPNAVAPQQHAFERALFGAAIGVFLLVFSLLWVAVWPRRTTAATLTLIGLPWRAAAFGLLTTGLMVLLLPPLSALLSATLVGLPLLALLLVALNVPYVYGFAITAHAIAAGRPTNVNIFEQQVNPRALIVATTMAFLIAVVAAAWPLVGLMLLYILASPGLGAAILSRGGLIVPDMATR